MVNLISPNTYPKTVIRDVPSFNLSANNVPKITLPTIDFSKDYIVVWVPGTNDKKIPAEFKLYIDKYFNNYNLVMLNYLASWDLSSSVPHGIASLQKLLDYIKKNKKSSTRVYLAGVSQGSLVSGEVLKDPKYLRLVSRTALLGHPGVSPTHYPSTPRVKEINNFFDFTTFDWPKSNLKKIFEHVDRFMTGDALAGAYLLGVGLRHPLRGLITLVASLKYLLPVIFKFMPEPHSYTDYYSEAVRYLKLG